MHSEHKIIGDPSSFFEQKQRTDLRDFFGFLELTVRVLFLDCNLGVGDAFEALDTPDLVLERVFIVDSINADDGPKHSLVLVCCGLGETPFFPARDMCMTQLSHRVSVSCQRILQRMHAALVTSIRCLSAGVRRVA